MCVDKNRIKDLNLKGNPFRPSKDGYSPFLHNLIVCYTQTLHASQSLVMFITIFTMNLIAKLLLYRYELHYQLITFGKACFFSPLYLHSKFPLSSY